MADEDVTRVSESIDGAIMEEIGSPDDHEFIDEPDISFVHEGEIQSYEEDEEGNVEVVEEDDHVEVVDETEEEEVVEQTTTEDVVEEEEVEDPEAPDQSPDEVEAGTSDEEAQVVTEEGTSPEGAEAHEPFTLRVDRQEHEVPGAYIDEEQDVVVIPRESFQRVVQPRLADRSVWQQERQQYEQQIEELKPENNPTVIKANTLLENILEIFEDEDKAYRFFSDFERNKDKLILEAERKELEAQKNRITTKEQQANRQQEAEQLYEQMDSAIDGVLEQAAEIDSYSHVDFEYVRSLIEPAKEAFFFRAEEAIPEYGLEAGEIGIRIDKIEQIIAQEAQRTEAQEAAAAASERNAAALGDSPSDDEEHTPTVPEPDTPTVTQTDAPEIESKEDWEARLAAVAAGR